MNRILWSQARPVKPASVSRDRTESTQTFVLVPVTGCGDLDGDTLAWALNSIKLAMIRKFGEAAIGSVDMHDANHIIVEMFT